MKNGRKRETLVRKLKGAMAFRVLRVVESIPAACLRQCRWVCSGGGGHGFRMMRFLLELAIGSLLDFLFSFSLSLFNKLVLNQGQREK